jgi:E3 ubiquitin-protein ligase TRIP12
MFKVLGQFVAKALFDGRIIDLAFSRTFMKLILEHEIPLTIAAVKVSAVFLF